MSTRIQNGFEQFMDALNTNYNASDEQHFGTESFDNVQHNGSDTALTREEKNFVGNIFMETGQFLSDLGIIDDVAASENSVATQKDILAASTAVETLAGNENRILDFVKSCGLKGTAPKAAAAVGQVIARLSSNNIENVATSARFDERSRKEANAHPGGSFLTAEEAFGYDAIAAAEDAGFANEYFGAKLSSVTDLRLNVAITVMRFHRSLIDKLVRRIPTVANTISFEITQGYVFEMKTDGTTDHNPARTPVIQLLKNPNPVQTNPEQLIPNFDNDDAAKILTVGTVAKDAYFQPNGDVFNYFDIASHENSVNGGKTDRTDTIAEGVKLINMLIEVTSKDGSTKEQFVIGLDHTPQARLIPVPNSDDIVTRKAAIDDRSFYMRPAEGGDHAGKILTAGKEASVLFDAFDSKKIIKLTPKPINASVNLKTGNAAVTANGFVEIVVGSTIEESVGALQTALDDLTFEIIGISMPAYHSNENLRYATTAVDITSRNWTQELGVGKVILFQHAIKQAVSPEIIQMISKIMSVGNDAKHLKTIKENMEYVAGLLQAERGTTQAFGASAKSITNSFPSSTQLIPVIISDKYVIDKQVQTMKESEYWSDVVSKFRLWMTKKLAYVLNESMYNTILGDGEVLRFRVLCSGPVAMLMFATKTMYPHLDFQRDVQNNESGVNFSVRLQGNIILDIVTTTFDDFSDTLLMFPVRQSAAPGNVTDAFVLADGGTWTAAVTPTQGGASSKLLASSSRENVLTTCPVGLTIKLEAEDGTLNDLLTSKVWTPKEG